ncbi:MAG TPA: spore germination protein GerW family protein [Tepidiformaceae bacterium]|nr:hypothetical protein [Dehalococcoidia bacterium]HNM78622.1 spore germination protein GerW family protein [Tepidiformaceae bacterium]HNO65656.1 spore germination protein GerW family protein [Tepidiformaceae bacterium]
MADELSRVLREAQEAASGRGDDLVERLASRIGLHANSRAVFGEAVERDGVTVVPVTKVRWFFGAGSGRGIEENSDQGDIGEGSGGGGGLLSSPLGFIEIREGRADFRRINDPVSAVPIVIASGIAAWLSLRGLTKLLRG